MAHDVSSISFPLTHRVNVFGLVLFVINGTSKAQCDTFLRIWVCQGHINIINEQEADWREMEWQREGWGSKQEGDIYFCQFGDIYLPVILIMIAFAQPLWVMERQFVPRDLERLPTISLVYRDGWMAAFFFSWIHLENHIYLCSFMPSGKELGSVQRKLLRSSVWRQLYLSGYVALLGLDA